MDKTAVCNRACRLGKLQKRYCVEEGRNGNLHRHYDHQNEEANCPNRNRESLIVLLRAKKIPIHATKSGFIVQVQNNNTMFYQGDHFV